MNDIKQLLNWVSYDKESYRPQKVLSAVELTF